MSKPVWLNPEPEEGPPTPSELDLVPAPKGVGFSSLSSIEERSPEEMATLKRRFAYELLMKDGDAFEAALSVTSNTLEALRISETWAMDLEVRKATDLLQEEYPPEHFLPTKVELCRKVWGKLDDEDLDVSDFVRLSHHYSELRAFFPDKKSSGVQNNIVIQNKVMKVVDHGTRDEWSEALSANQIKLQEDLRDL